MPLPHNYKELVIKRLKEKGVLAQCEICNKNDWTVVEQAVSAPITDLTRGVRLPQPFIPCAGLICNHCGNVRLLALGALGIETNSK